MQQWWCQTFIFGKWTREKKRFLVQKTREKYRRIITLIIFVSLCNPRDQNRNKKINNDEKWIWITITSISIMACVNHPSISILSIV